MPSRLTAIYIKVEQASASMAKRDDDLLCMSAALSSVTIFQMILLKIAAEAKKAARTVPYVRVAIYPSAYSHDSFLSSKQMTPLKLCVFPSQAVESELCRALSGLKCPIRFLHLPSAVKTHSKGFTCVL